MLQAKPKKLKIAFSQDSLLTDYNHPDCKLALQEAVRFCQELGHEVIEIQPYFDKPKLREAYFVFVATSIAQDLDMAARRMKKRLSHNLFEHSTWFLYTLGKKATSYGLNRSDLSNQKIKSKP